MKLKQFIFAFVTMMSCFAVSVNAQVAKVGNTEYATIDDAIANCTNGTTLTLLADLNLSEILTINKAITFDGNGKTLTSTAGRAINVSGADGVTIKNLTINASGERAINVINGATNVTVDNVTATAKNYTVNLAGSATAAVVAIKNSTLNGLCTVNVSAAGAKVTVDKSTVNCNDNNTTAGESYAALCLNKEAVGGSIVATNSTINVTEGSDSMKGRNGAENGTVTINGSTEGVTVMVAAITYSGSDYYHASATIEDAIEFAKAGDVVTLIRDVTTSEILVLDKAITFDGNGKTLISTAGRAINVSGADGVTIKNLTINASGERAINVINGATNVTVDNVTATAKNYTVNLAGSATAAVVAIKNSTLNGLCTVNVSAAGAKVTVDESTVNCNDNDTTAGESYAALCLNKDAVGGSIVATNSTINVTEGSDSMKGRNGAENGTVTINGSTEGVTVMVAAITYSGSDYYHASATIEDAIEFAKTGDVITLIRDVTTSEIIVLNKAITFDGNGKTLTSSAGRAINVDCEGNVAIKNLTIYASGERAINVIQKPANVTIENVTATAKNYTVNVAASAPNAVVAIANSNLIGLNVVNVAAPQANVTIDDGTITCNDQNEDESYTALALNKDGKNATIAATGVTFDIKGDSKKAKNGAEGGVITIDGKTDEVVVDVAYIHNGGDYYYAYPSLEAAIANAKDGETITLIRDVTMDYNARDAYETQAQNVVINGNGKTLTLNQKNSDWASIGLANNSKLVLNNMTIEKTGYGDTSGAWNTHAIIFTCPVEMNGVTVNNSIAVQAGAALTDVTINEANGYYGLWINGNGQAVEVNGGSITATNGGRGIKIADQYIDSPAQVTLSVTGTVFTTAKKAAVLVSSKGGANITASNVNIENVAEDKVNFVWVDEDWAEYFSEVEVTGATVGVEGAGSFAAAITENGAVKSYYKTLAEAIAAAEAGESVTMLKDVTLDDALVVEEGMDVTVNGEGKTITGCDGKDVFYVKGGKLTLTEGLNVHATTDCAIYLRGGDVFTAANLTKSGDKYSVIQGNGNYAGNVTITGGKVEASDKLTAIYWPQNGKLTITGGEITGHSAVYIASGSLEITGGKLHGVGANGSYEGVTGGSTNAPGEALTIENVGGNSGYEEISSVVISGGEFISDYTKAVGSYANTTQNPEAKPVAGFICGGTFSSALEASYCAEGYGPYAFENGTFGVESLNVDDITIVDGAETEFVNQNEKTVGTLTYKRSNIKNTWTPFYVPFAVPVSALADKFDVAYINDVRRTDSDDDGELDKFSMEIIYIHGGNANGSAKTLKANYPYFIRSKSGQTETMEITLEDATLYAAKENVFDCTTMTEKFEIKGNYHQIPSDELTENDYVVGGGEWHPLADGYSLNPFRFYMTKSSRYEDEPAAPMKSMRIIVCGEEDENGATIIYDVVEDSLNNNGNDFIYDLQGRRVSEPKKGGIYIKNGKKILF